ncbi:MAG: 3D domain-containing protein [Verrucomicrobiota bacterium]|nr:3D domain-containing protein [Verrucomicrobiota bacterium]
MNKGCIVFFAGVSLLAGCASSASRLTDSAKVTATRGVKPGQRLIVRTTAYTHTEPGGSRNGIGTRLRFNKTNSSAASDWSWLPLGTRFKMLSTGRTYIIEDYGSALVGRRTVDLYMPTRRMMNNWGMRYEKIEILEWGSSRRSLEVLGDRRRHGHVRTMVYALRQQSKGLPRDFHRIEVR